MRLQEPSCKDDRHAPETLSWMAAESGTFYTDEGLPFQVGSKQIGQARTGAGAFYAIKFDGDLAFANTVSVLTQVQTYSDTSFVKTRQQECIDRKSFSPTKLSKKPWYINCATLLRLARNTNASLNGDAAACSMDNFKINNTFAPTFRPMDFCPVMCGACGPGHGFLVALEGAGANILTKHKTETVAWFAMESSVGTMGGGTTAYESKNARGGHKPITIRFEQSFANAPRLFASIGSFNGWDAAALRSDKQNSAAFARVFVEEETCSDVESGHLDEDIHYLALQGSNKGGKQTIFAVHQESEFESVTKDPTKAEALARWV